MGGYGSGRKASFTAKTTTESLHRIDIRWLKKQGYLHPSNTGLLSWTRGGEKTGSINYRMENDHMILSYRQRPNGEDWKLVEQLIFFDRTPCNYGGYREWFRCSSCRKRVAVLYGAGKYFLCRHCYDLTYASQQENEIARLARKAQRIRGRLGASSDLSEPIWCKPKNMHQKTFYRLRKEADQATDLFWAFIRKGDPSFGSHFSS